MLDGTIFSLALRIYEKIFQIAETLENLLINVDIYKLSQNSVILGCNNIIYCENLTYVSFLDFMELQDIMLQFQYCCSIPAKSRDGKRLV